MFHLRFEFPALTDLFPRLFKTVFNHVYLVRIRILKPAGQRIPFVPCGPVNPSVQVCRHPVGNCAVSAFINIIVLMLFPVPDQGIPLGFLFNFL